jgi:PII-like signaling protein
MERMMQLQQMAVLLRILIGDGDRFDGKPLYEAIVLKAREHGLAGATVLRGPMGFGHSSQVHTAKILRLSENLPVVVEIIDTKEQIDSFLPMLDEMMIGGLVSLEDVRILRYGSDRKEAASSPG